MNGVQTTRFLAFKWGIVIATDINSFWDIGQNVKRELEVYQILRKKVEVFNLRFGGFLKVLKQWLKLHVRSFQKHKCTYVTDLVALNKLQIIHSFCVK